ncbi:MAG: hypothetical protein JSV24_10875 [Bacteroidales bacterium]|nr:MAG: hypothetical protein JSV24_10875 [Bacteroidales bacterium]
MKNKYLILIFTLLFIPVILNAQSEDNLVNNCAMNAGENTTYLKDYIIKLPEAKSARDIPTFKTSIILVKNTRYRFSICNAPDSEGEGILQLFDHQRRLISSYDEKSGKMYDKFDFPCTKTGQYSLWYSFIDGKKGMAVGIVSLVKFK